MEQRARRRASGQANQATGAQSSLRGPDAAQDAAQDAAVDEPSQLSPGMLEFVESMGRYFEQYGISRIGGRILGLLAIAQRPLSLDEIATHLQVSRASVSTNLRLATASDLAELVTFPGDRRDYYRMIDDAWGHGIRAEIKAYPPLRRIAERALATLGAEDSRAREQLEEMIAFCDFAEEEWNGLLDRWQARREAWQRRADTGMGVGATGAASEMN